MRCALTMSEIFRADRRRPAAAHAVELEQMDGGAGAALDFVDVDDRKCRKFRPIESGAQRGSPHASKPVDSNPHGHIQAFAAFTALRRLVVGAQLPDLTESVAQAAVPKPAGAQISGCPPQQFSVRYASKAVMVLKFALYMIDRLTRREVTRPAKRSWFK